MEHYINFSKSRINQSKTDLEILEKRFNLAKKRFNEIFDIYYLYIYRKEQCEEILKQKRADFNELLNEIDDELRCFSDDLYLYNLDEFKNIYSNNFLLNNNILSILDK